MNKLSVMFSKDNKFGFFSIKRGDGVGDAVVVAIVLWFRFGRVDTS